jgi:deazaflavin-dependent oxidoreductase (nitroreductase family)
MHMSPSEYNQKVIDEFRANGGVIAGRGRTVLLLHTIGAKSHKEHVTPVAHTMDGDRYVIIASKGGAPNHPDWYYNIVANPKVTVEVGIEKFEAQAVIQSEPERTRLFNQMAEVMPGFAEYQKKTTRTIPVVVLTRV